MDHASRGADALNASDGATAVVAYTKAMMENPTAPDYFIQRSTAFTRVRPPRYDWALQDAEWAIKLGQKRAKREKIQTGQQRRVVALFGLGRYGEAKQVLETMVKWRPKESKPAKMWEDMWRAKVDSKIGPLDEGAEALTTSVKEYPDIVLPDETERIVMFQKQLNEDGTFNFDGDKIAETAAQDKVANAVTSNGTTTVNDVATVASDTMSAKDVKVDSASTAGLTTASSGAPPALAKVRHEWYQSAHAVTITIYAKGVQKDQARITLQDDSVFVTFPHPSSPKSPFVFSLHPLFARIDLDNSKSSVMSTKVEIVLRKANRGQKWAALEGTAPLKESSNGIDNHVDAADLSVKPTTTSTEPTAPGYPTSSKTGPKDWDKVASVLTAKLKSESKGKSTSPDERKEDEAEDDHDDGYDSDYSRDPVDAFFKKLYAGSDDDTRRAMMKSYQESHGTSLSTSWDDVAKGKVEPVESNED